MGLQTLEGAVVKVGQRWRGLADRTMYVWLVIAAEPDGKVVLIRDPPDYRDPFAGRLVRNTTHVSRMHEMAAGEGWRMLPGQA